MVPLICLNVDQAMFPLTHIQSGKLKTLEVIMLYHDKFSTCQKMHSLLQITGKILALTKAA